MTGGAVKISQTLYKITKYLLTILVALLLTLSTAHCAKAVTFEYVLEWFAGQNKVLENRQMSIITYPQQIKTWSKNFIKNGTKTPKDNILIPTEKYIASVEQDSKIIGYYITDFSNEKPQGQLILDPNVGKALYSFQDYGSFIYDQKYNGYFYYDGSKIHPIDSNTKKYLLGDLPLATFTPFIQHTWGNTKALEHYSDQDDKTNADVSNNPIAIMLLTLCVFGFLTIIIVALYNSTGWKIIDETQVQDSSKA